MMRSLLILCLLSSSAVADATNQQIWRTVQSARFCWAELSATGHERDAAEAKTPAAAEALRGRARAGRAVAAEAKAALAKKRLKPLSCQDKDEGDAERCLYYTVEPESVKECAPYLSFLPKPNVIGR